MEDSVILQQLSYVKARLGSENGATMVEYAIMVTVIAMVAIVGAAALGIAVGVLFDSASTAIP